MQPAGAAPGRTRSPGMFRLIAVLALTLVALATTVGTRATQPAGASLSACGSGRMCLWGNNDFKWKIGDRAAGGGVTNLKGDANDEMDSWANRSASWTGCMYDDPNGAGSTDTMGKNSNDNNVAPWNSDDKSSWRTRYGC